MPYGEKADIVRQLYDQIRGSRWYGELAPPLKNVWNCYYEGWQPVPVEDLQKTIASLPTLRSIENFYIRNVTISAIRPAIHMQFNCDGTHIVGPRDYQRFLEENL
jgi:hypothetical protein